MTMMKRTSGFTLVEVVISLAIFTIIAAVLFTILIKNQQSARVTANLVEAQQNARIAVDVLSRDVRMAGYGIDAINNQPVVQYAGPFEVMYNANMQPYPDTSDPRGDPQALDWTTGTNLPPHSLRLSTDPYDTTGAETIVYTLDANGDGDINDVDVGEGEGNEQARDSYNPHDMMLIRRVYGYNSALGQNTVTSEEVALVRGPLPAGTIVEPMFLYWLDTDRDGIADSLYGDTEAPEGELNENEIAALTPLVWPDDKATLRQIGRVTVTVIGEMPEKDKSYSQNLGYRQIRVSSEVTIPKTFVIERREIAGTVYRDCGGTQTGLPGWRVELSPAIYDISAIDGTYSFEVAPGVYPVELKDVEDPWYFRTGGAIQNVDVTDGDRTDVDYFIDSPYGTVYGYVFHDIGRDGVWDEDEGDSTIKYTPGDTAALGWGIALFGHVGGGIDTTETLFIAPPVSYFIFGEFAWRDSLNYGFVCTTLTDDDNPNPYIYVADIDTQMPNECDFNFRLDLPLIKASIMPDCDVVSLNPQLAGGMLTDVFWEWNDPDTDWDSISTSLYFSMDSMATWEILRYTEGPDSVYVDSITGDSLLGVNRFRWLVPHINMGDDYDLYLKVRVDDPDTMNDTCETISDSIHITHLTGMTGQYLIRDRVPGTRRDDRSRGDTIHVEGLQVMPRINVWDDSLWLPDRTVYHDDALEEDTARAIADSAGVYDLTIFWQQDTVVAESLTGDTTPVYSDSAVWISIYDDPMFDIVPAGIWRFYLWGNYESEVICQIKFIAEVYCCDDEGSNREFIFNTDSLGTVSNLLPMSPGRDLMEIKHGETDPLTNCERLLVRLMVRRMDDEEEEAKVYFYYNGATISYMLTPRVPE